MSDGPISVITGTVSDDAIAGPASVWGVAVDGSLSSTAIIQLHDNVSFTGTILVQIQSDTLLINFLEGRIAQLAAEQQKLGV